MIPEEWKEMPVLVKAVEVVDPSELAVLLATLFQVIVICCGS
jgi:hypothetical protein